MQEGFRVGRDDDSKYVNELAQEIRQEKQQEKQREAIDEVSAYIAKSKTAIQNETTRKGLIDYWSAEKAEREILRIVPNSPDYEGLYSAYKSRGLAIANQHQEAAE